MRRMPLPALRAWLEKAVQEPFEPQPGIINNIALPDYLTIRNIFGKLCSLQIFLSHCWGIIPKYTFDMNVMGNGKPSLFSLLSSF